MSILPVFLQHLKGSWRIVLCVILGITATVTLEAQNPKITRNLSHANLNSNKISPSEQETNKNK